MSETTCREAVVLLEWRYLSTKPFHNYFILLKQCLCLKICNNIYTYDKNFLYTLKWLWKGLLHFSHENNKQSHKQQLYWQTKVVVGHFSTPWPTTEAVYSEQNSLCALTGYEVSKDVSKLPSNTKRLQLYASLIKCYMYAIFIQLYLNAYLIWSFKLKYLSITVLREAHMNTLYQGFKPIVNNLPLNNFTATKDREGQLISTSPLLEAAIKTCKSV